MKDKKARTKAINLILKCGVPPCLVGYEYLTKATEIYAKGNYSITDVYRIIAEQSDIKPKSVMRNISYAISQSFDFCNRLSDIMGIKIPSSEIHNALVISYLATKINDPKYK